MGDTRIERRGPSCPVRKGDLAVVWHRRESVDKHFQPTKNLRMVVAVVAQATRDGYVRKVTWRGETDVVGLPLPDTDSPIEIRRAINSRFERVVAVLPRKALTDYERVLMLVEGREWDPVVERARGYSDALDAIRSLLRHYRVES